MSRTLPIPSSADADQLLEAFMGWAEELGLELYPAQEEAILEIFDGRNLVLNTPTGSGKSLVAVAAHLRSLARGERSVYTSPIKALVSEKFFSLCDTFGAENVGMLTGDGAVNGEAPIVCCTAEVLANQALMEGADTPVHSVVMDEFHYYSDRDRGTAWQLPLLILEHARFVLMSATLGDTDAIVRHLEDLTGAETAVVSSGERPVPLEFSYVETPLLETLAALVKSQRAPVYLVNFSQREASEMAQNLSSTRLIEKEQRDLIRAEIKGFRFDSPYGKTLRRFLEMGIGVHHAGLLPKYRLLVERLAQRGLLAVICGTDTLGVGVNVPIRTVLFTRLYKFDGEERRILSVRDFHQIAGRAGRKGFDERGYVVCQAPAHEIENIRLQMKVTGGLVPKKKARKTPPPRDYVPYNRETFERLLGGQPEALQPVFSIDHGMLVNLMKRDPADCRLGHRELLALIERSHGGPGRKARLREEADRILDSLVEAGLVHDENGDLLLGDHLQEDFSVFHSLSLYLLDAVGQLDLEEPDHDLRIVSLVESILEDPRPVLFAQRSREKGEAVARMKAEGMEYEDRIAALEDVTWPKPDAEWIYETFNRYVEHRPWLSAEHIRPKGVARELLVSWATFGEYVRELKLSAVEGVLLRYLSQAYKVLARSIPESLHDDALRDDIAFLRATIAHADSSLLTEWEKLLQPAEELRAGASPRPFDISRDAKSFTARVRAELHQLVKVLARQEYDEAPAHVRNTDWEPGDFEGALAPFFERYGTLRFDHEARLAQMTLLRATGTHQWAVTQTLLDPEGDCFWSIEGRVDLRGDTNPEGPLVELQRIGE